MNGIVIVILAGGKATVMRSSNGRGGPGIERLTVRFPCTATLRERPPSPQGFLAGVGERCTANLQCH